MGSTPNHQDMDTLFATQGYRTGLTALGSTEAATMRARFDELEARAGRETSRIGLLDRHFDEPFLMELATNPAILDAVEAIFGPDLLLLATHVFCKYGPEEQWVAWHQDVTYWGLEPPVALTAWYAVDDAEVDNGCMRVIPGSHRDGIRTHGVATRAGNLLSINQEAPVTAAEEAAAVDLPLRAGQFSLHDGCLVHGSLPNRSTRRRCGLTLRYVPTSVRQGMDNSHGKRWRAVLVRGEDRFGNFG